MVYNTLIIENEHLPLFFFFPGLVTIRLFHFTKVVVWDSPEQTPQFRSGLKGGLFNLSQSAGMKQIALKTRDISKRAHLI